MRLLVVVRTSRFPIVLSLAALAACEEKKNPRPQPLPAPEPATTTAAPMPTYDPSQLANFAPLPAKLELPDNQLTDDKVALGRMLYFDARLSKGQDVACASCHDPAKGGADDKPLSTGTKGQRTLFNAPTVYNAAGGFTQGWEGRATIIEEYVVPHVGEPQVMGADVKRIVDVASSIPAYAAAFKKVFPGDKGGVTAETFAKAVSAYVRKLVTPGRWDRFLLGEQDALTAEEKAGLGVFMDVGCPTCHAGKYVGASMNQKLGLAKVWPGDAGAHLGRFAFTKQDVDKGVYKVPTLRNVTLTAPYLHDGSVQSLDEMVHLMSRHQLGKELDDAKAKFLLAFLAALGGDPPPKDLISKPDLPAAGAKTPKPE
jgi:cytochrome c peroxidase